MYITQTNSLGEYLVLGATEIEMTIAECFRGAPDSWPDLLDQADKIMLGSQSANNVNFVLAKRRNVFWRYG